MNIAVKETYKLQFMLMVIFKICKFLVIFYKCLHFKVFVSEKLKKLYARKKEKRGDFGGNF